MIYTVTFSPAVDYVVEVPQLKLGEINRTKKERVSPGGKGINVSTVLANLGQHSVATGFIAGFTGQYIKDELYRRNIKANFIDVDGLTRINVKIKGHEETAVNGQGPHIGHREIEKLIRRLEQLNSEDLLVISGSIPASLPNNIYELILDRIEDNGVTIIIDTTKDILLNTLRYKPFLVKPNKEELEEIFNVKINSDEELIENAKKLLQKGAQNVIVSLGGDGALLVGHNIEPIIRKAPQGKVVNTVGAGDSLIAGFIDEYVTSGDIRKAFKKGIAAGSATAFSETLATREEIETLYRKMVQE